MRFRPSCFLEFFNGRLDDDGIRRGALALAAAEDLAEESLLLWLLGEGSVLGVQVDVFELGLGRHLALALLLLEAGLFLGAQSCLLAAACGRGLAGDLGLHLGDVLTSHLAAGHALDLGGVLVAQRHALGVHVGAGHVLHRFVELAVQDELSAMGACALVAEAAACHEVQVQPRRGALGFTLFFLGILVERDDGDEDRLRGLHVLLSLVHRLGRDGGAWDELGIVIGNRWVFASWGHLDGSLLFFVCCCLCLLLCCAWSEKQLELLFMI
mmetsp:Transcript_15094/g.42574  ORF Transcript_15094/g.42574 Transcript_15094/m.42574 type:complete len:269 (+) Transcript_15094:278-1084(+)